MTSPRIVLAQRGPLTRTRETHSGRTREIIRVDPRDCERLLGPQMFRTFLATFIWSDRLVSLASLMERVNSDPTKTVRNKRDRITVFLFTVGSLTELARAIQKLTDLGVAPLLDTAGQTAFTDLQALAARSQSDAGVKLARDKICFHVDDDILEDGLKEIAGVGSQPLVEGDSLQPWDVQIPLAGDALFNGLASQLMTATTQVSGPPTPKARGSRERRAARERRKKHHAQDTLQGLMKAVRNDHVRAAALVQQVFLSAMKGAETHGPAQPSPSQTASPAKTKAQLEAVRQALAHAGRLVTGWQPSIPLEDQVASLEQSLQESRKQANVFRTLAKRRADAAAGVRRLLSNGTLDPQVIRLLDAATADPPQKS